MSFLCFAPRTRRACHAASKSWARTTRTSRRSKLELFSKDSAPGMSRQRDTTRTKPVWAPCLFRASSEWSSEVRVILFRGECDFGFCPKHTALLKPIHNECACQPLHSQGPERTTMLRGGWWKSVGGCRRRAPRKGLLRYLCTRRRKSNSSCSTGAVTKSSAANRVNLIEDGDMPYCDKRLYYT